MSKEFAARRLDVRSFAEEAAALSGEAPLGAHARLQAEAEGRNSAEPVRWSARGELRNPRHVHPEIWIHLEASAVLPLTCQRCLQAVDVPLSVMRSFRFVADEATAAAQDDESEEDVLALSRAFDIQGLVEDELLMAVPLAPRHETCPETLPMAAQDEDFAQEESPRDHPFAVLGTLRGGKPPSGSH